MAAFSPLDASDINPPSVNFQRAWNSGYNACLADSKVLITAWIAEHVADAEFDPHSLLSYLAEKQPPKDVH